LTQVNPLLLHRGKMPATEGETDMTDTYIRQTPTAIASAVQDFAQRALNIQAEIAEGLVQANRHWIEQYQTECMEAADLARRFASNDTSVEKVSAIQTWLKGVGERGIRDASYAIEVARALGSIELKLFAVQSGVNATETPKAA
jgi:hypothetical protein